MTRWWRLAVYGIAVVALVACGDMAPSGGSTSGGRVLTLVGEPTVTQEAVLLRVHGRVKNTSTTKPYTGNIGVTFFDASGKIVANAVGTVQKLPPGEEITYTAVSSEKPAAWARVEAKITLELSG